MIKYLYQPLDTWLLATQNLTADQSTIYCWPKHYLLLTKALFTADQSITNLSLKLQDKHFCSKKVHTPLT